MSHLTEIVFANIDNVNKWANFFDSVVAVFNQAPQSVQENLQGVNDAPGFLCEPTWQDFDSSLYDSLRLQSQDQKEYWSVTGTMMNAEGRKVPPPQGAVTECFSPVRHYPDRVEYAYENMLTEDQTLSDLTPEQLAELSALGNDYYITMASDLWESFTQDTIDFLYSNLGTPVSVLEKEH